MLRAATILYMEFNPSLILISPPPIRIVRVTSPTTITPTETIHNTSLDHPICPLNVLVGH